MARYRLSIAARHDLAAIGRYTLAAWGQMQRGYRSTLEGQHVIFYRRIVGAIEIIRVLHVNMDVQGRFSP